MLRPHAWKAKIDILEAHTIDSSSYREFARMFAPESRRHPHALIKDSYSVLRKVMRTLRRMQEANFCRSTVNVLVIEKDRPLVAHLTPIEVGRVSEFAHTMSEFLRSTREVDLESRRGFLRQCDLFLASIGLDVASFGSTFEEHWIREGKYAHLSSPNALLEKISYAARAVAFVLEFATISYCGGHLEPFDEVYFESGRETISIPCDDHGHRITISRRPLACLAGFLQDQAVWAFCVEHPSTSGTADETPLYLSTTPEELADVWGPVWKSVPRREGNAILRFMVAPGSIVPSPQRHRSVPVREGEVLCHWTESVESMKMTEHLHFPEDTRRLLIGAWPKLLENPTCHKGNEFFTRMIAEDGRLRYVPSSLKDRYEFLLDSLQTGIPSAAPGAPTAGMTWKVKKNQARKMRDDVATLLLAEPCDNLHLLDQLYGIEISACTGHARRMTLAKLLASNTFKSLLNSRKLWADSVCKTRYFHTLESHDRPSTAFMQLLENDRHMPEYVKAYEDALKYSAAALTESKIDRDELIALYSKSGQRYWAVFSVYEHKWAKLLTETPQTCAFFIVDKTCLQCAAHPDHRRHEPIFPDDRRTVLETAIVLNHKAHLPSPLVPTDLVRGRPLSRDAIERIPQEAKFELREHGRVRVVGRLPDGSGLFVAPERTFGAEKFHHLGWKIMHGFRKNKRRHPCLHWERKGDERGFAYLRVLVVSTTDRLEEWLPIRIGWRHW
jgi:hypothetical protein